MTDNLLPTTVEHRQLVAFSPGELGVAQTDLRTWCEAKSESLRAEQRELRENVEIAKRNKWRVSGLQSAVSRLGKRILFYDKIAVAVGAGYLVMPDFDVNVFAIRTDGNLSRVRGEARRAEWIKDQAAAELPVGEGVYVSQNASATYDPIKETQKDGTLKTIENWFASGYQDVEFPVSLVKPQILEATERAMGLRIFDRLGIVQKARHKDPIVAGQIIRKEGYTVHVVNFFVAWWLDTRSL